MKKFGFIFIILALFGFYSCKYDVDTDDGTSTNTSSTTPSDTPKPTETPSTDDTETDKNDELETIDVNEDVDTFKPYTIYVKYYVNDKVSYIETIRIENENTDYYSTYGMIYIPTVSEFMDFDYWYYTYFDDEDNVVEVPFDFEIPLTKSVNLYAKEKNSKYTFNYGQYCNLKTAEYTLDEIENYITNHINDYDHNYTYSKGEDDDFTYLYVIDSENGGTYHSDVESTMSFYKTYIKTHDMTTSTLKFVTLPRIITYNVEFDLNGGEFVYYTPTITYTAIDFPSYYDLPKNEEYMTYIRKIDENDVYEYTFDGWYDENENLVTRITYETRKNCKFHAKWSSEKIYLYVNYYDGDILYQTNKLKIKDNPKADNIDFNYNVETKEFLGWVDSYGNDFDFNVVLTENVNLYTKSNVFTIFDIYGVKYRTESYVSSDFIKNQKNYIDSLKQCKLDNDNHDWHCFKNEYLHIVYDDGENVGSYYNMADSTKMWSENLVSDYSKELIDRYGYTSQSRRGYNEYNAIEYYGVSSDMYQYYNQVIDISIVENYNNYWGRVSEVAVVYHAHSSYHSQAIDFEWWTSDVDIKNGIYDVFGISMTKM